MSSEEGLNESIQLYTDQLSQVELALVATTSAGPERDSLLNLRSDLQELLQLTRETIEHEQQGGDESDEGPGSSNDVDDEYALFMSEIDGLDGGSKKPNQAKNVTTAEAAAFKDLVGSKCSAPHVHKWGSKSYHNALICSLDAANLEAVTAKVLFINPTHQEMVPCAYFLEGDCKFSDDKCRFSHGEVVSFAELKEYQEPRFELLRKKGGRVLAKQKNRLWSKGTIKQADFESKSCKIQIDEGKHELELQFEDILPLEGDEMSSSDSESDSDSEEMEAEAVWKRQAEIIQRSLLNPAPSQRLGEWEKHTKGIGSKIMQKMGYVVGAGLGSRGEGIVVPVSAQVLPQGKSLDYCMQLREQANGDSNLFNVEKKLLRQKRIQEKRDLKQYAKGKEKKKDVFNFLNSEIFGSNQQGPSKSADRTVNNENQNKIDLPNCSVKNLNIASLKLAEQMRRLEMDIEKLTHSLTRHQPGSKMHANLRKQIVDKQREVSEMQKTEHSISREQQLRNDKRKMTVF